MMPSLVFPRGREIKLFRPAVQAVVKNLHGFRAEFRGFPRLKFAALLLDGNAEMADFAGAFLFRQHRPEVFVPEQFVRAGVELIQVNCPDAERPERGFELGAHAVRGKIVGAVQETVEVMAELGRHNPARAVMPRQVIADQPFGKMVRAVAFGGVHKVDAAVGRRVEDGIGVGLREIAAPFAAELPGAGADDGDAQTGFAKNTITHGEKINAATRMTRIFGSVLICGRPPTAA